MVDNKVCLVVMVAFRDSPLVIKNILGVLVVLVVLVDPSHFFLDLMVD
jgi:hypothetical protein